MRFAVTLLAPTLSLALSSVPCALQAKHLMRDVFDTMIGDWDNHEQCVEDAAFGRAPGPGGGHEHMHCKICDASHLAPPQLRGLGQPILSAKYYFNGDPSKVFRYRLYSFSPVLEPTTERGAVEMRLWRFLPHAEAVLRTCGYDLREIETQEGAVAEQIQGCNIYWDKVDEEHDEFHYRGLMGKDDEGTWIDSQNVPGLRILVKDDLKLFRNQLWVNDRGFDAEVRKNMSTHDHGDAFTLMCYPLHFILQGNFVYGNQRGVPYKLKRVIDGSD